MCWIINNWATDHSRALAVIKVTRIVSAASISMFFVRRIHFIYFLFFRVEFIFLGNNMHVTKTNLVTTGAWAYIWLKFWGTHGERRRWFGAEWCGLWEGMFPLKPTRGSVRGSVMSSFSGPKTDFCVFWRPQNASFCTYMTKSGDSLH